MKKENTAISRKNCLILFHCLSIIPEDLHPALAELIGNEQNGSVPLSTMKPSPKELSPAEKELQNQRCQKIFAALRPEYQEIIIEMMQLAISAQSPDDPPEENEWWFYSNQTLAKYAFSKYSINSFAEAMHWTKKKTMLVLNNKTSLSKPEMEKLIKLLDVPAEAVAPMFFGKMFE